MRTRLEIAGVVKTYHDHRVLDRAWLQVKSGEAVGLIASGAGKTTLLRIAAGLVIPDTGLVRILKVTDARRSGISAASERCRRRSADAGDTGESIRSHQVRDYPAEVPRSPAESAKVSVRRL